MKKTILILLLTVLFSCDNSKNGSYNDEVYEAAKDKVEMTNYASSILTTETNSIYKKYDIKSGIITFETKMEMDEMIINKKKILYFDDYGIKESQEEYEMVDGKETLASRDFVKDGYRYTCSLKYGNGSKTKARGYGVASAFNMEEASTMKDNQFKKLANETICGKPCNSFSMVTPSGDIKMYGWNRITLRTTLENASMKMKSETVATKVEENVSIPADKFEVPKDVVIKDM